VYICSGLLVLYSPNMVGLLALLCMLLCVLLCLLLILRGDACCCGSETKPLSGLRREGRESPNTQLIRKRIQAMYWRAMYNQMLASLLVKKALYQQNRSLRKSRSNEQLEALQARHIRTTAAAGFGMRRCASSFI
jgi:hypothetical protein